MWLQKCPLTYVVNISILQLWPDFCSKETTLICKVIVVWALFQPHDSSHTFEPVPVAVDVKPVNLSLLLLQKNSKSKEGSGLSASAKDENISSFRVLP